MQKETGLINLRRRDWHEPPLLVLRVPFFIKLVPFQTGDGLKVSPLISDNTIFNVILLLFRDNIILYSPTNSKKKKKKKKLWKEIKHFTFI